MCIYICICVYLFLTFSPSKRFPRFQKVSSFSSVLTTGPCIYMISPLLLSGISRFHLPFLPAFATLLTVLAPWRRSRVPLLSCQVLASGLGFRALLATGHEVDFLQYSNGKTGSLLFRLVEPISPTNGRISILIVLSVVCCFLLFF